MKNATSNTFYKETVFNTFPYDLPSFPPVHLTNLTFHQLHYHSTFEIGYCYHGSGECSCSAGIMPFKKGDAEFFFPFQPHISRSNKNDISVWNFSYFDVSEVFLDSGFNKDFWEKFIAFENGIYGIIEREKFPDICDCIKKIIESSRESDSKNKLLKCRLLIGTLLANIVENRTGDKEKHKLNGNKRINKLMPAVIYVKQNYDKQITVAQLAQLCFMSVSSFRENFSREIGMSPQEYLISVRMRHARYYLENSFDSILNICKKCGFSDTANFYKQFSKKYGISPTAYRKQFKLKSNTV